MDAAQPDPPLGTSPRQAQIWVDADACPGPIKDILYRAAIRHRLRITLVSNQALRTPTSPYLSAVQVPRGFDEADRVIAARVQPGDLVVTADIPLAAQVIERGGQVIDPRGEAYGAHNIGERLAMRDFMDGLRSAGVPTGGPAPLSQADRHAFARALDRMLPRPVPQGDRK